MPELEAIPPVEAEEKEATEEEETAIEMDASVPASKEIEEVK